jgi:hypothetical protein
MTKTRRINANGIGLAGDDGNRLRDIYIYDECGTVMLQVEVMGRKPDEQHGALQYLTAYQAMEFAKAFERCAIAALKYSAETVYD